MTTETFVSPADQYTPDAYVLHVNDLVNWRPGLTMEIINGNKKIVAAQVIRDCRRILGETVDGDGTPIAWPEGLTPAEYVASLARRISCWLWPRYTEAQRARMMDYAARYTIQQVKRLVDDLGRKPKIPREVRDAQPRELHWEAMNTYIQLTDAHHRMIVMLAYIECHPGAEADGEELAHLAHMVKHGLVGGDVDSFPFF